jgi:hypothetical protein
MPAQSSKSGTVYFVEYDTAPPLTACLKDGNDDPIDLSGSTVTISVAFAMPRGTYYTSPRDQIVLKDPVDVDPDQVANKGWVSWTPGAKGTDTTLSPPGEFLYTFQITYPNGGIQTIPANTYQTLIIRTPVGGRSFNDPLPPQPPQP